MKGAQPPRSCYSPCSAMPWACLRRLTSISPAQENWKLPPPTTASAWLCTPSNHGTSCSSSQIGGSASRLTFQEFLTSLHVEWEERLIRWALGVRHELEAGDVLPPFPTETADTLEVVDPGLEGDVDNGVERSGRHCWRCHREQSDNREQGCHVRETIEDPPDNTQRSHSTRDGNIYT